MGFRRRWNPCLWLQTEIIEPLKALKLESLLFPPTPYTTAPTLAQLKLPKLTLASFLPCPSSFSSRRHLFYPRVLPVFARTTSTLVFPLPLLSLTHYIFTPILLFLTGFTYPPVSTYAHTTASTDSPPLPNKKNLLSRIITSYHRLDSPQAPIHPFVPITRVFLFPFFQRKASAIHSGTMSSSSSTTNNESTLLVPNPTPTSTSRRGSIPRNTPTWAGVGDASGSGNPEDPASSLRKEMNLVAEAAKRASVAIVVRDMQEFSV